MGGCEAPLLPGADSRLGVRVRVCVCVLIRVHSFRYSGRQHAVSVQSHHLGAVLTQTFELLSQLVLNNVQAHTFTSVKLH